MIPSAQIETKDLLKGKIHFVQHFLPPLQAGDYKLEITQTVSSTDADHSITEESHVSQYQFTVLGERFQLKPNEIVAGFPPPRNQGDYGNTLPHLVFHRKTLPWERTLKPGVFPSAPIGNVDEDYPSWLVLLVFYKSDPPPPLTSGTVADLAPSSVGGRLPADTASYTGLVDDAGKLNLDYGEKLTDPVQFIDVPKELFNQIAPSFADQKLLAHARSVDVSAKSDKLLDGDPWRDFSVVVANRLPALGSTTTVHLVSLEGMNTYLPQGDDYTPSDDLSDKEHVRLASLYKWQFTAAKLKETFAEYLLNLNQGGVSRGTSGAVGLQGPQKTETSAEKKVNEALQRGYVALNHHTRNGQRTVSWYRGPLAPFSAPIGEKFPRHYADSLLHYNPETGMFDVSYAAAWELGRLLALNNPKFAQALYKWKKNHKHQLVRAVEMQLMAEQWQELMPVDNADLDGIHKINASEFYKQVFKSLMSHT